jgi:hypothetical protein
MKRARGYSASLDIGRYPVADEGYSIWNSIMYVMCCCCRIAQQADCYDSDSSNTPPYKESDTDDE